MRKMGLQWCASSSVFEEVFAQQHPELEAELSCRNADRIPEGPLLPISCNRCYCGITASLSPGWERDGSDSSSSGSGGKLWLVWCAGSGGMMCAAEEAGASLCHPELRALCSLLSLLPALRLPAAQAWEICRLQRGGSEHPGDRWHRSHPWYQGSVVGTAPALPGALRWECCSFPFACGLGEHSQPPWRWGTCRHMDYEVLESSSSCLARGVPNRSPRCRSWMLLPGTGRPLALPSVLCCAEPARG